MESILYVAHGSRSKVGVMEAKTFMERVIEKVPIPIQEMSFLELTDPSVEEGFARCISQGASSITIVPLFLLAAGHVKKDIPFIINNQRIKYPEINISIKNAFGIQEQLLDGITEMIKDVAEEVRSNDTVLVVARGSSDPTIHQSFHIIAEKLQQRLRVNSISICYLAATKPNLHEGFKWATETRNERIIVIPYLLFSGVLFSEITKSVYHYQLQGYEMLYTPPLSKHPAIENLVIESTNGWKGVC